MCYDSKGVLKTGEGCIPKAALVITQRYGYAKLSLCCYHFGLRAIQAYALELQPVIVFSVIRDAIANREQVVRVLCTR